MSIHRWRNKLKVVEKLFTNPFLYSVLTRNIIIFSDKMCHKKTFFTTKRTQTLQMFVKSKIKVRNHTWHPQHIWSNTPISYFKLTSWMILFHSFSNIHISFSHVSLLKSEKLSQVPKKFCSYFKRAFHTWSISSHSYSQFFTDRWHILQIS